MSTFAPLRFSGVSSFSADFEQILTRAVSIAQLPVRQIQGEQAKILTKKQLLGSFQGAVSDLQAAVKNLGEAGESRSLVASSSASNRVTVQLTGTASPNAYSITDIASVARAASETTLAGFADSDAAPVDDDGIVELVIGGAAHVIDLAAYGNNLNGLRDAVQGLGVGVTATVLNTGTGDTPYYLSLGTAATGATTLQLRTTPGDGGSNLLTAANQGADAVFKLNGLDVSSPDNTVNGIIPGVSLTIAGKTDPGEAVAVSLVSSRGRLAGAIQDFVSAYNSVAAQVDSQIGEQAGLLSGDIIVRQAQGVLRQLTGYRSGGAIGSLAELGVESGRDGRLTFDSSHFNSLSSASLDSAFQFFGSTVTGFGGLQRTVDQVSNPFSGLIALQLKNYDQADIRLTSQVEDANRRISLMQASLSTKLQQADALLSQLQGQQAQLTSIIESFTKKSE